MTKQRVMRRKKNIPNARIQKGLLKDINEQGDLEKPCQSFPRETEQYLGTAKKRDDKGGMTAPRRPGPSATENKQRGQKKAVCLVKFLCSALYQQ